MNDIINDIESEILIFADDTSLFATGSDPAETAAQINRDLLKISNWAEKWKVQFNAKKSKDIVFSNKYLNNSPPLIFNNNFIERVNVHKHLGIYLSSSLDWSVQVHEVSLKANRKLSVLRSVNLLSRQTLDLLYKITVRSVIDYGLPIYCQNLKQTEIYRLEQIQYRAAKIVTGALHLTSREKLNSELGWETIQKRSEILGLCFFHKIHSHDTRTLIRKCMPEPDFHRKLTLRSKGGYIPYKNLGNKFQTSFFPYHSRLWNNLPKNVRSSNIDDFKSFLRKEMKPNKHKHFNRGNKFTNSLVTRIRVGRSALNEHKFVIGQSESPQCLCYFRSESPSHYFLDCFLYSPERQILFGQIEHYIPNFLRLSKQKQLEIILMGAFTDNEEYYRTNVSISLAVQNFISHSKRFNGDGEDG